MTSKKTGVMSKEEALELARAQKGDTDSPAGLFYALLHNAHPVVLQLFEDQLAVAIQVGDAMGRHMANLEPGSTEHAEFVRRAHEAVSKTSFAIRRQTEETVEDPKTEPETKGEDVE
jgi:hypothetical protein